MRQLEKGLLSGQVLPSTRTEHVYRHLKDAILAGRIAPGQHLVTQQIANRLNVSLTPVRESLRALAKDGLVRFRPHRGAVVTEPDRANFVELYQVRAELEQLATQLAAERLDDRDFDLLDRTLHVGDDCVAGRREPDDWREADDTFHQTIIQCCGNSLLIEMLSGLQDRIQLHRLAYFTNVDRIVQSLAEHRQVVEALQSRSSDAAKKMYDHLTSYLYPTND